MTEDSAALDADSTPDPTEPGDRPDIYEIDSGGIDTEQLARDIVRVTWDLKAVNAKALDLRGRVSYTDFIIVASANSDRHVRAIAEHVQRQMDEAGWEPITVEGVESGEWAVLDFADVVVHIFNGFARREYDLEGMWVDADELEFDDRPDELYGHFQVDQFEDR